MKFEKNEEVVEYLAHKLTDNLENYEDFVIVKQSKALLKKFQAFLVQAKVDRKVESEIYDRLQTTVQNMLFCHATSDDENEESSGDI